MVRQPAKIQTGFAGTAQAYQDSLGSEPLLIATALATVYIVLGILYESYIHPVTILSALPSAGVGALLALELTHTDLSVIAIMGIILTPRRWFIFTSTGCSNGANGSERSGAGCPGTTSQWARRCKRGRGQHVYSGRLIHPVRFSYSGDHRPCKPGGAA